MALTQARTMPGTLELLPPDQIAFQRMLDTVRRNFERFGFLPIETPVMEFSDVLLTKQGGETERQVYFVQSTGALEKRAVRFCSAIRSAALPATTIRSRARVWYLCRRSSWSSGRGTLWRNRPRSRYSV